MKRCKEDSKYRVKENQPFQGFGILRKRVKMINDVLFGEQPFCVECEADEAEKKI